MPSSAQPPKVAIKVLRSGGDNSVNQAACPCFFAGAVGGLKVVFMVMPLGYLRKIRRKSTEVYTKRRRGSFQMSSKRQKKRQRKGFNEQKAYGLIPIEDGRRRDEFVHLSDIKSEVMGNSPPLNRHLGIRFHSIFVASWKCPPGS
jgi:cold shock CspA family protein